MKTLSIIITIIFNLTCYSQEEIPDGGIFNVLLERNLRVKKDSGKVIWIPEKTWIYQISLSNTQKDTLSYTEETFERNIDQSEKYNVIKSLTVEEKIKINNQRKKTLRYLKTNEDINNEDYPPSLLANKQETYAITFTKINDTFDGYELIDLTTKEHFNIYPFGARWAKPPSWSNDGILLADEIKEYSNDSVKFAVINVHTRTTILSKVLPYYSIQKIAWNNTSNRIAILFEINHTRWYHTIFHLLGSHGVYGTYSYHLLVMDLSGNILFSKTLLSEQDYGINSELLWTK